ncbi:hypothetical protein [Erythrobacter sp. THAF29]|uniref:hypothetical protein n=1 Tax=Erythrobacter sp. THAF29 TaxID=2587851 RepID=UPI001268F220|nr:hypothetical protein [Erythrobacter sp. THAF29]QFT76916.1 hypothetical protein FIU90_05120 [Erythrobacter sp. THAF29]
MARRNPAVTPPPLPEIGFSIGITGHRLSHGGYAAQEGRIEAVLGEIFDRIDRLISETDGQSSGLKRATTRLNTLMVDGADQAAAYLAIERGWELVSPLPFGERLNLAINSLPEDAADARALLAGDDPANTETKARADRIVAMTHQARTFALADQDERIAKLYLAMLDAPSDFQASQRFTVESSIRAALAGRIIVEQSDLVVGVWDGVSTASLGGTGHTIAQTLEMGSPVIWIDPERPEDWRFLHSPESLATLSHDPPTERRKAVLEAIVEDVMLPNAPLHDNGPAKQGLTALYGAGWEDRSSPASHGYRRVETLFGGAGKAFASIKQTYEKPEDIGTGSAAALIATAEALPGVDRQHLDDLKTKALYNFAWADGISAKLSDRYRGGMTISFLLSAIAIVGGVAYLPLVDPDDKWIFALFEFGVLLAIVLLTWRGVRGRWHGRWFETRRVAEYFRHSPFMLLLGVSRPPGRWPTGTETSWPEWVARHSLRRIGLPRTTITSEYLRRYLTLLLDEHVEPQRDYHALKAKRLRTVHHRLDELSELLFKLAILSVAAYLTLKLGSKLGLVEPELVSATSKTFTVLGVAFPTFGAAIAGMRFFGDFERFASISDVTNQRLSAIANRIELLKSAADGELDYARVAELAHATADVVVSEIEAWQSVFSGKHITVPV